MDQMALPGESSLDFDIEETTGSRPEKAEQSHVRDRMFEMLSNRRRRFVLYYLQEYDGTATVRELAGKIAAWENDIDEPEVSYKQRKRVYTALYQSHLPRMAEYGIIEYEPNRGTVDLTPTGETLEIFLEVVGEHDIPWSDYFVGLSVLSFAFVLAVVWDVPPFVMLSEAVAGILICTGFLTSALIHLVRTRQSRVVSRTK